MEQSNDTVSQPSTTGSTNMQGNKDTESPHGGDDNRTEKLHYWKGFRYNDFVWDHTLII